MGRVRGTAKKRTRAEARVLERLGIPGYNPTVCIKHLAILLMVSLPVASGVMTGIPPGIDQSHESLAGVACSAFLENQYLGGSVSPGRFTYIYIYMILCN